MLWDIIRDWFVEYVWGGVTSTNATYGGYIGTINNNLTKSNNLLLKIGENSSSRGDWLSTTSTIIVLVLMCAFLFLVVRDLFRLTSGLIRCH